MKMTNNIMFYNDNEYLMIYIHFTILMKHNVM